MRELLTGFRYAARTLWKTPGFTIVAIGLAVGLLAAFASASVLSSLIADIDTHDPLVFATVPPFLLLVALVAAAAPAFRASRVDPMIALRYE